MKRSRAEEIFFEDLRIRQNAIDEGRRLSLYERKHLRKLADEAKTLKDVSAPKAADPKPALAGNTTSWHSGPEERDPSSLPASMRPGAWTGD